MHKVGILSDTHDLLRPEVLDTLKGCEVILHAGDICKQRILDQLGELAPVKAVRGNADSDELVHQTAPSDAMAEAQTEHIPETLLENVCGLNIFMVHNKKFIPKDLTGIDLVIYGHSHKYEDKVVDEVHYLNPGSCGPRRFHQEITLALLWIPDAGNEACSDFRNRIRIEKILIPHPNAQADSQKGDIPTDIGQKIPSIMKDINAGKTVKQIARKYKISEELSEQIARMYLTHPGVDVDGIMRRIGL